MLTIEVNDTAVIARLSATPDKLRAAFLKKTYTLAEKLKSKVQQNLTNRILKIQTGKLVRSIFEQVTNSTNEVSGRVYSSGAFVLFVGALGDTGFRTLFRLQSACLGSA